MMFVQIFLQEDCLDALPIDSIEDFIEYVQPDWKEILQKIPCETLGDVRDEFIPYLLGAQTKLIADYLVKYSRVIAIIQSCRIQDLITSGYDNNDNLFYVKRISGSYK